VSLVSKEMDKRTLYALLAKPVRRWEFLLGKFVGLVLTLAVNTSAMASGLFVVLRYVKPARARRPRGARRGIFILLKLALVVALALLFSCYTTPLLAILFTCGLYVSGLFVEEMRSYRSETMTPAVRAILRWLSYVLPNFQNFDVMASAAHGQEHTGRVDFAKHCIRRALLHYLACVCCGVFLAAET